MRDTGDLAAAGRGPKFSTISDTININPIILPTALVTLRFNVRLLCFVCYGRLTHAFTTDYNGPRRTESQLPRSAQFPST